MTEVDATRRLAEAKARREEIAADAEAAAERARAPYRDALAKAEVQEKQSSAAKAAAAATPAAPLSELAAALAAIAPNTQKPGLTVAADAGVIEASVLAATLLAQLAEKIAARVRTEIGATKCIMVAGNAPLPNAALMLFNVRRTIVAEAYKVAQAKGATADAAWNSLPPDPATAAQVGFAPAIAITAASGLLQAAAAVGSYFIPDRGFVGLAVSGIDDRLLVIAIAGRLGSQAILPQYLRHASPDGLLKQFGTWLVASDARAETTRQRLSKLAMTMTAEAASVRAQLEASLASDGAARALVQELLVQFAVADSSGETLLTRVLAEQKIDELLNAGAMTLHVHVHAAAGGSISEKAALRSPDVQVSGGCIVSYLLTARDGTTVIAGTLSDVTRYIEIKSVDSELEHGRRI